jgi:hypothetical protein
MKELISAVIFVVGVAGGTAALKTLHDNVRKAALEKAAQGLPSLSEINKGLRKRN